MDSPVLEVRRLTKCFGALKACDEVSLTLQEGEIHAVIGPNGAGKSTLIAQICGSLEPDSGSVFLNGQDITRLPTRSRARAGLARTFQISTLALEDTVLQNVLLGTFGASGTVWKFFGNALSHRNQRERAEAALERVRLADVAAERAGELSHGQRRRLEVAIALTLEPLAFVMDEPMAGLGFDGTGQITALLNELRKEAPILLVEHDMDAVFTLADRISVLDYGKVIASGTVAQIRSNPDVRAAYLGADA